MPYPTGTIDKKHLTFDKIKSSVKCPPATLCVALRAGQVSSVRKTKGFTLIELLVVISIIGILVAVAAVSYTSAQRKGRDNKRKKDLNTIQQALVLYFETNGKYPDTGTGADAGEIKCNVGTTTSLDWGTSAFTCNSINYIDKLPKDPINQSTSGYYFLSSGTPPNSYVLSAALERTNDPEYCVSTGSNCSTGANPKLPCEPANGRSYCVINP